MTDQPTLSALYHALRTSRRRQVIQRLSSHREFPITVRSLARYITSLEEDIPEKAATGEPYRNVYNALSQTHLSTLDEADIVRYDSVHQLVEPGDELPMAVVMVSIGPPIQEALVNLNHLSPSADQSPIE